MRRLVLALLVASSLQGQDAPPPAAVPQAVKALESLNAQPNAGPTSWTNGPYAYDGAGNIQAIGPETYVYDKIGRLTTSTLRGPDLSSMQTQSFGYDDYGNLISTARLGQTVNLDVTPGTNRLTALGYDSAGNVVAAGVQHYDYDALGMPNAVRLGTSAQPRIIYAYTADDERLFAFDVWTGTTHWTLRGLDNKVDFKQAGSSWSMERDYVYRDGLLLAALRPGGVVEHYSLDHLGTPRLVTDGAGHKIGYHVYWPFGEEWSPGTAQENSPLKFTGHERDADPSGGSAALDYMHARYYGAGWGRFLSVDRVIASTAMRYPQMWNRYSYAMNDPVRFIDPKGLTAFDWSHGGQCMILCAEGTKKEEKKEGSTHETVTVTAKDPGWLSALTYRLAMKLSLRGMGRDFSDAEVKAMMGKNHEASLLMLGWKPSQRIFGSPIMIGPLSGAREIAFTGAYWRPRAPLSILRIITTMY
jgi:RHS repeat-associated protein